MKFVRFLLFPFAVLYDLITKIRNLLFDFGIFKSTSFSIPVIIVGNLSVGGTGKTPQIEYLIRLLKDASKVAVLSRGYKRETTGFLLLNKNVTAEEVGDEPLQYFKKFKNIDVAVDANRVSGINRLIKEKKPEVILLDDAFQHRKVKGSFYILLTKYNDLFVNDFLLPTGNLRESSAGAKRSDVIVVTKCPEKLGLIEQEKIKKQLATYKKDVFFTKISYKNTTKGSFKISIDELKEYEVLLITGIANPKPLINFLSEKEINFKDLQFSDHHNFSLTEIKQIEYKFAEFTSPKKMILTTEKDYVRLEKKLKELSYLEIETVFLNSESEGFNTIIKDHIKK